MKFLADMGISQSTINWLIKKGYDATHIRNEGLQRISDSEIITKARKEERIILTCDLDFGHIMAVAGEVCPSIIIFRLENEKPENINRRLAVVLKKSSEALAKGVIISVEETRHRVRVLTIIK